MTSILSKRIDDLRSDMVSQREMKEIRGEVKEIHDEVTEIRDAMREDMREIQDEMRKNNERLIAHISDRTLHN